MKSKNWFKYLGVATVLTLAACGGGGGSSATPDVTTPALEAVTVASGMNPSPDGFAFPNFASSASTAELDTADMVTMFGSTPEICVDAATPCVLTAEASAWARMVNQARISGHCEGLAVLSAARFTDKLDPKTFTLTNTGDVTHALIRAFATQFFKETQDATKKFSKKSPSEIVATLSASLKSGVAEYTLGVYTDIGGHAILPIGVEFPSADIAHIKVYDSNWPNADRYVEVNLKEQTWSFAFSGADAANDPDMWTGGKGDIDITPFSARSSATCPFCGDKSGVQKSLLLVRSALPNWSIETADGTITPGSTDVGDTSVRPVRAAGTTSVDAPTDYLVSTTIGATGITLHLGSTARVSGVTPDAVFEVNAPQTTSDTPVTITNTSVAVDDPKVILTVADKNLVASGAGDANTVSSSGDAVSVELTTTDGKVVTQEATLESPAIEVRTGAAQGVTEGISYEVLTQVSTTQVEKLTIATDGKETTTKTDSVLDNQKQTVVLPDDLKAPEVKGGLSPTAQRDASGTPIVTTTTIAGAATATTVAGATPTTLANITATTVKPKSVTSTTKPPTKPATTTTIARGRSQVDVTLNIDAWTPGVSDLMSSGFSAVLTITNGGGTPTTTCTDIACVEGTAVSVQATGVDPTSSRSITTSLEYNITKMAGPFEVRCGTTGAWIAATGSGTSYSAKCTIDSITKDETLYLRA